jgi:magnesium-transporting ATPase (P-type)
MIPFSSSRKRATAAINNPRLNEISVFVKGAPEIVMDLCDTYHAKNGKVEELD